MFKQGSSGLGGGGGGVIIDDRNLNAAGEM